MKKLLIILGVLVFVFGSLSIWFQNRVTYSHPDIESLDISIPELKEINVNYYQLGNSWLKKNKDGNWESYIEGSPYERGLIMGALHKKLVVKQEEVFVAEIKNKVPNWIFRNLLRLGIGWFNRDLDKNIPQEYCEEIFGISRSFSDDYDFIGPKYNRIMNYHAAHDIGHMVQNMRLVGCTAVGAWQYNDSTSQMIVGRNFDFFFGDDFAKEKIVLLMNPTEGHRYLSVTWGGFCGIVSGMNEKGLGITLNSDKSEIPNMAATPVSIVARDILQYAQNIDEAISIANKYQTFVSESFTISSAQDSTVVVLEKTPQTMGVYRPNGTSIVVTNHFQSPELRDVEINKIHMASSESVDRYARTKQLLDQLSEVNPTTITSILRNKEGIDGEDIGISNPKAINQLLAHHAVIFSNMDRKVWVSNYPFQENIFNFYDLTQFDQWTSSNVQFPLGPDSLSVLPDPFYLSEDYQTFQTFLTLKSEIIVATQDEIRLDASMIKSFVASNPNYYETYRLLGDYFLTLQDLDQAKYQYEMALTKDIAYQEDKNYILSQLQLTAP